MTSRIPTETLPLAQFLVRHLYRPIDLGNDTRLFALAETELPCQGDIWFWTDDNAKALELMSRPELWRAFPEQTAELLRFVRTMCDGPFIYRRVSVPRLEATGRSDGFDSWCHSLLHTRCDLSRGMVVAGVRFHDGRTADNVLFSGNTVAFSHKGRRFRLDVEDAIDSVDSRLENGVLTLRHASALRFTSGRRELPLGRISYTYTLNARSLVIGAEIVLEVDPQADIADVVLTLGHDYLSHGINGVYYTRLAADSAAGETVQFVAGKPSRDFLAASGARYYGISQPEIAGLALAIHTVPRDPARLEGFDIVATAPGRLHLVRARYRFDGPCRGARLAVGEDKVLTAGGFYERTGDYTRIVNEAVAAQATRHHPLDVSISYDYGAEINAFAKCFAVCASGAVQPRQADLPEELRSLFDRYLERFFEVFVAGHIQGRNTIISRQLAFVILGAVTMYHATRDERYRREIGRLCEVLLDFEIRYEDVAGTPAGGFTYGVFSQRAAFVDGHSASLLALTQALRCLDDARLAPAVDRGLEAYGIDTCRIEAPQPFKVDTITTTVAAGDLRHTANAFWNFNIGIALRFFAALRNTADPALQAIAARHAERLELLDIVMQHQLERSIIERDDGVEIAVAPRGGETNSETQPWVGLGLFGHPFD